ncbi:hypothetical protein SAMN02745111_00319 [Eubacterium uniforme]|uniref:Uncharacterized protein n=1 Tax=Eubacterium uniforme TaxID=39495 RepID=A0A1T4V7Q6_9FIRM|nr:MULTISPECIES: hypothetical protein [Eubacterium]MCR5628630.1 hypothetical protein [Eubacterium sp.]SKA60974.1 hypothetical protein SAMN02745111_00319 [Eubacterium uniforme]
MEIRNDTVKYYLSHPDLEQKIWDATMLLKRKILDIEEKDETLREDLFSSLQMKSPLASTDKISSSGSKSDLFDIIDKTNKILEESKNQYLVMYEDYLDKLEEIKRVDICFSCLDLLTQDVLNKKYRLKYSWYELEHDENKLSHRQVMNILNNGIEDIVKLFNSQYNNLHLARNKDKKIIFNEEKENIQRTIFDVEKENFYD